LRFTRDALESLAEAHAKGIIHRDLKPDNLFLSRVQSSSTSSGGVAQEACKVLDFGIAKWSRDEDATKIDQLETQAGTVFGTPRYMSPEQAQGTPLDARSDLYSLGVLLYQMLSGRAPFVDDDAVVVMARHIKDPPPRFDTMKPEVKVPESIEALLWRVLAKSPAERPATAEQMIAELDAAEISVRALESGPRLTTRTGQQKTLLRRYGAWFALGALALVSLAWVVVFGQRRSALGGASPAATQVTSGAELQSRAAPEPEPAPLVSLNTAENSALPAAPEAPPSASSLPAARKPGYPHNGAKPALRKKGNERYGRFE
jgi:eukaryotic-like serine/threonine-protein kinase